ncbi:hypothetical protein SJI19_16570 [Acerihabitans sp. TG2]|uniref:hypothetical protein n=1 Tax=Acerihabitans sp. TG2 TaxID=3096008 RepID=UPI002B2297CE|nr:hypothetical protein [Acerihabitans sp. TG2]MEA9392139.1 hypothetical protein [Acerihabitans sp. TG2]
MGEKKNPVDQLSKQDKARLSKASYLISGMSLFMRWASSFSQYEMKDHPKHNQVKLFSPVQSGRFCLAFSEGQACLGVQPNEAVWLKTIPFDYGIADDRLYLTIPGVEAVDIKFPSITLGILIESSSSLENLKNADMLSFAEVKVRNGYISEVIGDLREPVPLLTIGLKDGLNHRQSIANAQVTYNDFL